MHAIAINEFGGPENLVWTEVDDPEPGHGEVLVEVAASAVNRADVNQRRGNYPPPPGVTDVPGLECSGTIAAVGGGVTGWQVGDKVCALLAGGGYAERAVAPAGQLLPVPENVDLATAASLPEVTCTVWSNVIRVAGLSEGEVLLVHGGASGIGTHAIQVAKALGARVAVTAGSAQRLERCAELGADILVNYKDQDFVDLVREATEGHGADVVLDNIGAKYLPGNVDVLASGGRLVIIAMQGGRKGELDIGKLLGKRASVTATGLRSRPLPDKAEIVADVTARLWPMFASSTVKPVVHDRVPMPEAARAHRMLEAGEVVGKLLLTRPS